MTMMPELGPLVGMDESGYVLRLRVSLTSAKTGANPTWR